MTHPVTPEGTLSEPILDVDNDGDGVISHGDFIKFTASTNVAGNAPLVEINLRAYQGTQLVASGWFKPGMDTGLYSPVWLKGPAACQADLGYFDSRSRFHVMDTVTFQVVG